MESTPAPLTKFSEKVLRWRWPLMVFMGLLAVFVVILEHSTGSPEGLKPNYYPEALLLGILVPAVIGLMLTDLAHARKRAAIHEANAVDAERYRLSRDLHDTLAQQITYLHFKLDQMAWAGGRMDPEDIRRELEQTQEVAGEAYKQIYDMLAILRTPPSATLPEALHVHADRIGRRAHLQVRFSNKGEPCLLSPEMRQQILYIFSEILSNVEEHAGAQHVDVGVTWEPGFLSIAVCDDGRGFETKDGTFPGHYGLAIMRERATDIGGKLHVTSNPGTGTEVTLSVRFDPCASVPEQRVLDRLLPASSLSNERRG